MNARRRVLGSLAVATSVALSAGLPAAPTPVAAEATSTPTLSAFGTAGIDGVMNPGEWGGAARLDFDLLLPALNGGGSVPASLFVMNDAVNLYVAVKAHGHYSAFNPAFEFDNDDDGVWPEQGDDAFLSSPDEGLLAGPLTFFDDFRGHCPDSPNGPIDCAPVDGDARYPNPGTRDGAAAGFSSEPLRSSFVEMSHPLDSADDAHDFSLAAGTTVGFHLKMRVISTDSPPGCTNCIADTTIPSLDSAHHFRFAHIRVATPTSAPLHAPPPAVWVLAPGALPLQSGDVQMAPSPDGGLYVLVTNRAADVDRSVLTLLDSGGRPRDGWPISVIGWLCDSSWWGGGTWDPSPDVLAAADGSVRVVCMASPPSDADAPWVRVFAFSDAGRALPGWPVDLPYYDVNLPPRMVGDRFVSLVGGFRIQSITADGKLTASKPYAVPGSFDHALGPDGFGYILVDHGTTTEISAIDLNGLRRGWPKTVKAVDVGLAFGPPGFVYLVSHAGSGSGTRVRVLTSSGRVAPTAVAILPVEWLSAFQGAGDGDPVTLVAADRSSWVFGMRGSRMLVYALDKAGTVRRGWPRDIAPGLQPLGSCEGPGSEQVTGCGYWLARPAVGPGDVLFFPRAASAASTGGSLVALAPDGRSRPGWPVTLRRAGAFFQAVDVGANGTVYAVASEPEGASGRSATILAIAPDSTTRWSTTVVEPTSESGWRGGWMSGSGWRDPVAFDFYARVGANGQAVGWFQSTLRYLASGYGTDALVGGTVSCGSVSGNVGVLGGLMTGADPGSPESYFTVMVSDGPDGIILGTERPDCDTTGFGVPGSLPITTGQITVVDK